MGHRASYAIVRDGRRTLYSSRRGAIRLAQALFYGPDPAIRYVESLERVDWLYDDVWCEGAVLLDVDAKRLLRFASFTPLHGGIRRHFLALMRHNWPGWKVCWADGDIVEIARDLGIDPATVRDETLEKSRFSKAEVKPSDGDDEVGVLITVRQGGDLADYGLGYGPTLTQLLARGPALLGLCDRRPTVALAESEDLEGGALLDADRREVWVWWNGPEDDRRVEQIARSWPDWSVRRHVEGLRGHVERSGRDPGLVDLGREEILRQILGLLAENDTFDPATFIREIEARGHEIVSVAPDFLRLDKPELETSEKRAILAQAVAAWRKS
jgi:hypothetical protein